MPNSKATTGASKGAIASATAHQPHKAAHAAPQTAKSEDKAKAIAPLVAAEKPVMKAEAPKASEPKAAALAAKVEAPKADAVKAPAPAPASIVKAEAPKAEASAVQAPAPKAVAEPAPVTTANPTTIQKEIRTMTNDTIQATQAAATDRIQAVMGDVNNRAKTAMEKSTKVVEELTEFTKGNVEAFVASSKVAARGVETLGQEVAEYGRRSFEEASAALKSFAEVKSPTDFFKLQSDYARSAFDSLVSESSKVSEAVIKLAGEVAEPITGRYSVAAERVKSIAA